MVHSVLFQDGQAKAYSNHWIRCKRYLYEKALGSNLYVRVRFVLLLYHWSQSIHVHVLPILMCGMLCAAW